MTFILPADEARDSVSLLLTMHPCTSARRGGIPPFITCTPKVSSLFSHSAVESAPRNRDSEKNCGVSSFSDRMLDHTLWANLERPQIGPRIRSFREGKKELTVSAGEEFAHDGRNSGVLIASVPSYANYRKFGTRGSTRTGN
jgi:hypothetical protein